MSGCTDTNFKWVPNPLNCGCGCHRGLGPNICSCVCNKFTAPTTITGTNLTANDERIKKLEERIEHLEIKQNNLIQDKYDTTNNIIERLEKLERLEMFANLSIFTEVLDSKLLKIKEQLVKLEQKQHPQHYNSIDNGKCLLCNGTGRNGLVLS